MNKFKQAIAYLINKIKTMYHAAEFFLSLITLEFLNDQRRLDYRARNEASDLRVKHSEQLASDTTRRGERDSLSSPVSTSGANSDASRNATDFSCCGMFGFFDRDSSPLFGNSNSNNTAATEGNPPEYLQAGETVQSKGKCDHEWDLIEPTTRQSIILDKMREYQSRFEEYCIFSVHDVVELCDRPDVQWDLTFDDLTTLKNHLLVRIVIDCDRTKKFYGLFWGLR